MLDCINEALDEVLPLGTRPQHITEGTITLVAGTREYSLASDFASFARDEEGLPVLIDTTNGQVLYEYPGGFDAMRRDQLQPGNYTGLPQFWCINPTNGKIRPDAEPTASEAGRVYRYMYVERTNIAATTDTFPITDEAVDRMIPAAVQMFKRERGASDYSERVMVAALARAAELVPQVPQTAGYGPSWL